jgi:hypothetical protein
MKWINSLHLIDMKRTFLFALTFLFSFVGLRAQSGNKLYGYSQIIIPGIAAKGNIGENGNGIKQKKEPNYQYRIYLTTTSAAKIYPIELWIKGQPYSVKTEKVTKTQVEDVDFSTREGKTTVLVPKTTANVFQWLPTSYTADKNLQKARDLASTNELVAVYKQGGKTYYKTLKRLTVLPPQSRQ